MIPTTMRVAQSLAVAAALLPGLTTAVSAEPATSWDAVRSHLFGERQLADGRAVLALDAPARAHDAAVVPMTIEALIPQTDERYIETLYLVIDENPAPIAAVFHLHPTSGIATIETRVRVNAYTPVHAVAETSDGQLYVVERFVKAAGGCSAPALKDSEAALADLGRMKVKQLTPFTPGDVQRAQLLIRHPNYTGMQTDALTQYWIPPDYVTSVKIAYDGQPVLEVEGDISLSEDPSITFSYLPGAAGELTVEIEDYKGRSFEHAVSIAPEQAS
jgi:sulfur-oxidizing protein SoxY